VLGIWRRVGDCLSGFPRGLMLSDLHLASETKGPMVSLGTLALRAFVRGGVAMHFDQEADAVAALTEAGFATATLHRGSEASDAEGADNIRVIEAGTRARPEAA
jgi:hypothetical protein